MRPEELDRFLTMHESGTLVKPEDAGYVIAGLAVFATKDLSGKFVSWNEEALASYQRNT